MSAFLQPWMLWGLALASVPILIHLLNRRRYHTVRWAAMEFLRAAYRKNQKRLRVENLLLLLLRTAVIVLLVLALARPFLSGAVADTLSSSENHYTLVIDNSYSMGLNEGVSSPLARGVEEAKKIVSTLSAEDSVTLYLTNDNFTLGAPGIPRSVLRDSHEAAKVRGVLGRLRASTARSELVDTLALVADELDPKRPGKRVVLVTDLQRSAWQTGSEGERSLREGEEGLGGGDRTIRDLLMDIERKGATFQLVDVGAMDPENVAIVDLSPSSAHPLVAGNPETFRTLVRNYGRRPVSVDVAWSVDGEHKGARRIEVPAARPVGEPGEVTATFDLPPLRAGSRAITAEIPTDSLALDDRRFFVSEVREKIRVLAVDGDPNSAFGLTSETFFLKYAIAPKDDRIEVEVVDYLAFLRRDLTDVDVVILANLERVREDRVRDLEDYVWRGGGLVVFLGNRVDPHLTNRVLAKEGEGLLPGVLDPEPVLLDKDESRVRISLDAPAHPLLSTVLGPTVDPTGLWEAPRVWGYYRVTPFPDDPDVRVLLQLTDPEKSPALLERRFGKGGVLLFTTSADLDWAGSSLVTIPLEHEMVYYLTRRDTDVTNLAPFAAFTRELPERVESVQVTTPDGGKVKVQPVLTEGKPSLLDFRETEDTGIYRAHLSVRGASAIDAETTRTTEQFCVNVDAAEGDLRRVSPGELAERFPGVDLNYARSFTGEIDGGTRSPEGELWKGLLAAVLVLLLAEVFLARRFGDYARRTRAREVRA